eukprot:5551517-Prymnesium_polylepis.1
MVAVPVGPGRQRRRAHAACLCVCADIRFRAGGGGAAKALPRASGNGKATHARLAVVVHARERPACGPRPAATPAHQSARLHGMYVSASEWFRTRDARERVWSTRGSRRIERG